MLHVKFWTAACFLPLLLACSSKAARVDTVQIYSAAMNRQLPALVVTPEGYDPEGNKRYPVVYLLHGYSGDYEGWLKDAPSLPKWADEYQVILVFPDGGYRSWYVDSPVDPTIRFETFIAQEVVAFIDSNYRTLTTRNGRAIAGLSMGGHGAMFLAARHPGIFGAAGSMAGGLDLRPWKHNNWEIDKVLGDPQRYWENWEAFSAVTSFRVFKNSNTQLIIDCGTGDFFLPQNRAAHIKLMELGIPHMYTERPGEHNAAYWSEAVEYQLLYFAKYFSQE